MNKIRIAGAIASKTGITLYFENGAEMNLPNDSWRTKAILDEALPALARREVVEINLDSFSVEKRIETKTGGLVRFLKRTVSAIGNILSAEKPKETLVAVVNGKEIPGVEALERQMEHAAYHGSAIGLQRFLERIAAVIDDRGHTVDELLNFMKRGDLPIADDGSIIAYKVLRSQDDHFVDCHTKRVTQRLGSYVWMAGSLVDPSRRTQCSSGLHIARRKYLSGFPGDVITMVKIAPENVIAVPANEPDKMRVRAYHIVAVLPPEVHPMLRSNQPMTENATAAKMLADVVAGNHVAVLESVNIGGPGGDKVFVSRSQREDPMTPLPFQNGELKALDDRQVEVGVKNVKEAVKRVHQETAAKSKKSVVKKEFVAEQLPEKHQQALEMLADGKSQRDVERELHICRKTLRKLIKKHG